jgi:hypothetical protein
LAVRERVLKLPRRRWDTSKPPIKSKDPLPENHPKKPDARRHVPTRRGASFADTGMSLLPTTYPTAPRGVCSQAQTEQISLVVRREMMRYAALVPRIRSSGESAMTPSTAVRATIPSWSEMMAMASSTVGTAITRR